ncbi:hypothetical protein [Microbacterium telephonicum]|uniref:Squalene cyclase n=1 Tax=Microbacterium telephonicum TaxID=1714841 RepID=A0A498CA16_9MICO|nr:hypothetical protein [Microbacterium telephonicum]RLK52137.1 hypothetical protein C7474_0064 [Microbacterium telephonicum]
MDGIAATTDTIEWLLAGDPAVRWQVLRDLTDATDEQVATERAKVAHEGWGAAVLAAQDDDGLWRAPDEPDWVPNLYTMMLLREFGVDPADPAVSRRIDAFERAYRWDEEFGAGPFFAGEVEPCINGRVLALGAYFNRADAAMAARLTGDELADGGWNCEAPASAVSSFHSTICVLEGLREYEAAVGATEATTTARRRGEEYLLERHLHRRRSTGETAAPGFLDFTFPPSWYFDVLFGLDHFWAADIRDPRLAEAVDIVRSKAQPDGRWLLDGDSEYVVEYPGREQVGEPSRWNTLRALRVLRWWDAAPGQA